MTMKAKEKADEEPTQVTQEMAVAEEAPRCGKPHHLPALAQLVTCSEPAQDPDLPPGTPEHQHRHEDGETIYVW